MLNEFKFGPTTNVDLNDVKFSGWYQYNNYFDYLPFLAVFLKKSSLILDKLSYKCDEKNLKQISYIDNSFTEKLFLKII